MASIKRTNHHLKNRIPKRYSSNKELISIKEDGELILTTNKKSKKAMIRKRQKNSELDYSDRMESCVVPLSKKNKIVKNKRSSSIVKTRNIDSNISYSTTKNRRYIKDNKETCSETDYNDCCDYAGSVNRERLYTTPNARKRLENQLKTENIRHILKTGNIRHILNLVPMSNNQPNPISIAMHLSPFHQHIQPEPNT